MTKKVQFYTFGYAGQCVSTLRDRLVAGGMRLVDIRLSPFSRQPGWSKPELKALLGDRYRHLPALGNIHYRGDGPIQIADFEMGLRILRSSQEKSSQETWENFEATVLLCGCRDYESCHRAIVAEALRAEGYTVEELGPEELGLLSANSLELNSFNLNSFNLNSLDPTDLHALNTRLTRLSDYIIRLRCEDPRRVSRADALRYLRNQAADLAQGSYNSGGSEHGWPDPEDPFAQSDQITLLRGEIAEVESGAYPLPLPEEGRLLPEADFNPFAYGRLYNGKLSKNGKLSMLDAKDTLCKTKDTLCKS